MKKLLVLLLTTLLSFPLFGQEPERELSDYEKYRLEQEMKLYPEDKDFLCWDAVEEMPKFNGGSPDEFKKWLTLNVEYPKQAIEERIHGKVFVKFIVNKYGDVVNVEVTKSVDPLLDAEAVRVITSSPKWSPGFQNGTPVNVEFTFPINFKLRDEPLEGPPVVNNYYNYDYDFGYKHRLYFDNWYYSPYYSYHSYYDPFYYDYWYGYNPYYSGYYGSYWGYNPYYGYNYYYPNRIHYYPNNYYRGARYASHSALGSKRNYYRPYNKTYSSGYVNRPTSTKKLSYNTYTKTTANIRPTANVNRKTTPTTRVNKTQTTRKYRPTYTTPRTSRSTTYNKSRTTRSVTTSTPRPQTKRVQQSSTTQSRSTYSRPATQSRSSSSYRRSSTPSRSYSAPSRSSYSRSSTPSRSSSSYSRSSSPSRSYSSGSASRSSSSGSRSGGRK